MYYSFVVREDHRNYLRFLWYKGNDTSKDIAEFRMKVDFFRKQSISSIYSLKRTADQGQKEYREDAKQFVMRNFYVDDGLTSVSSEAVSLLQRTGEMLLESNLRLHKLAPNKFSYGSISCKQQS